MHEPYFDRFYMSKEYIKNTLLPSIKAVDSLINILVIVVLSMPLIGLFAEPNTLVGLYPYILLYGFWAPFTVFLYVASIKQVTRMRKG